MRQQLLGEFTLHGADHVAGFSAVELDQVQRAGKGVLVGAGEPEVHELGEGVGQNPPRPIRGAERTVS